MWNNTFGLQESLEYPESVVRALRKLEPFVELQLPCLPLLNDSQVCTDETKKGIVVANRLQANQTSQDFISQDDGIGPETQARVRDESPGRFTLRHKSRISRPTNFSSSPIIREYEPAIALPEKSMDLTPKQRLRHDDSQVQFIAVESSPALPSEPESQLLTEHQKEVKERQRNDPSMILNGIRPSSPVSSNARRNHVLHTPPQLRDLRSPEPVAEIPLTPTIPAALAENDDVFLGSSPTPGSKGRARLGGSKLPSSLSVQALDTDEHMDPPSSPPEVAQPLPKDLKDSEPVPLSLHANPGSEQLPAASSSGIGDGDLERPANPDASQAPLEGVRAEQNAREDEKGHQDAGQNTLGTGDAGGTSNAPIEATTSGDTNLPETTSLDSGPLAKVPEADNVNPNAIDPPQTATSPSGQDVAVSEPAANDPMPTEGPTDHGESSFKMPVDCIPDSFSDDMELQIASQLEQDLELAVDSKKTDTQQSPDLPNSFPMTRKRKREMEEASATPEKGKRRSTRSSSVVTRGQAKEEAQERRTIQTRRSAAASGAVEEANVPSLTTPASKKRKAQPKKPEAEVAESSKSRKRSLPGDVDKASNSSTQSPQVKRRSLRLSVHPASPLPETKETTKETPSRKSSRATRSQTQRTPRSQDKPEESRTQDEPQPQEEAPIQEPRTPDSSQEQEEQTAQDTITPQEPHATREEPEKPAEAPAETEPAQPPQQTEQDTSEAGVQTERMEVDAVDAVKTPEKKEKEKEKDTFPPAPPPPPPPPPPSHDASTATATTAPYVSHAVQTDEKDSVPETETQTEPEPPSETAIIDSLRRVLGTIKAAASISRSALRELDDLMFDIRVETHEAARRHHVD